LRFGFESKILTSSSSITLAQYTNGFTVRNTGTTLCYVAGVLLDPGESIAVGGNRAEVFEGRIDIQFKTQPAPPAVITNEATITQKFYTNING
jgi:hypothetical protein